MSLYDGPRLSEWAQPNDHAELDNPQLNRRGDPMAFCYDDLRFLTDGKVRIPTADVISMDPEDPTLGRDFIRYRTQKNGDDGAERQHTRNFSGSAPCHITSAVRIIQRFARLIGATPYIPLCVYRADTGRTQYITANIIEFWLRKAAVHVYRLDPVKDSEHLRKWSAHSLRVGACVILHGMGFTDTQIQFLLRWRSNAFYTYLRNIATLANQQNRAISDVMPQFI
jgi:hypothetical protein